MAINAFAVVSEFRFDVANAVLGSDKLQDSINGISSAADSAIESVKSMGIGFVANLSGAQAGFMGLIGSALSASDKFTNSQLSFATIIDSNMEHLTGSIHGLNEQMATSKKIMNDIANDASKFGLPANALLEMTKSLSAELVPKGLAGQDFGAARTLGRNFLKSAPNLNIDPQLAQGQLLRAIEGSASMGDTLFKRLVNEAPEAFGPKGTGAGAAKSFNALDMATRFEIINKAMSKFANNAGILDARANTLSGSLQVVKDLFTGFNSILKPLGDVIMPVLIEVFNMATKWLGTHGRELIKLMATFLKGFLQSPKQMFIDIMQVSGIAGDVATSAGFVGLIIGLIHMGEILGTLSKVPILSGIVGPLKWFYDSLLKLPLIGGTLKGFMGMFNVSHATGFFSMLGNIGITIMRMAGLFGILLIPLQGFTRAVARMKLDTLEWIANNIVSLTETFMSFKNSIGIIFMPIQDMIKGFEELFYMILGGTFTMDFLKSAIELMGGSAAWATDIFLEMYAGFRGLIAGMMDVIFRAAENIATIVGNLSSGNISGLTEGTKNIFGGYMAAGAEEYQKTVDRGLSPNIEDGVDNAGVSNQVHKYDVKMVNNFKEVLQPDRIAFTIKDQLSKASMKGTRVSGLAATQSGAI